MKLSKWTKDITGQRFNNFTALGLSGNKNKAGSLLWNFECTCGKIVENVAARVTQGTIKSCGCLRSKLISESNKIHGQTGTPEHKSWSEAKFRISNPDSQAYEKYGGKGLKMDDEFFNSFETFLEYIGKMPEDGKKYSLGRIKNDKGYIKGNIRWETYAQQSRNRGKMGNNTSGFAGVNWNNKANHLYAVATWYELNGTKTSKYFSTKRLGLLPAFAEACKYRAKMIEQLNLQGAGYSETHGK